MACFQQYLSGALEKTEYAPDWVLLQESLPVLKGILPCLPTNASSAKVSASGIKQSLITFGSIVSLSQTHLKYILTLHFIA